LTEGDKKKKGAKNPSICTLMLPVFCVVSALLLLWKK